MWPNENQQTINCEEVQVLTRSEKEGEYRRRSTASILLIVDKTIAKVYLGSNTNTIKQLSRTPINRLERFPKRQKLRHIFIIVF